MDDLSGARRPFLLGVGALALAVIPTLREHPYDFEAGAFDTVNGLPDSLWVPVWPMNLLGALAAVPAAAGVAQITGRTSLASRLLVTGTSTWILAKGVKRMVRGGRPADVLASARSRGRAETGTGFLSGHAGISAALATGVARHDPDLLPIVVVPPPRSPSPKWTSGVPPARRGGGPRPGRRRRVRPVGGSCGRCSTPTRPSPVAASHHHVPIGPRGADRNAGRYGSKPGPA